MRAVGIYLLEDHILPLCLWLFVDFPEVSDDVVLLIEFLLMLSVDLFYLSIEVLLVLIEF